MGKQDSKERRKGILKPIETAGNEFLQKSRSLVYSRMGCRQPTSSRGLNVEVQKITILHQGPKPLKGLKSRKVRHLGFQ